MDHKTNMQLVRESLRDLIKVYEPPPSKAISFVTKFIRQYHIDKGLTNELIQFAQKEIAKLEGD